MPGWEPPPKTPKTKRGAAFRELRDLFPALPINHAPLPAAASARGGVVLSVGKFQLIPNVPDQIVAEAPRQSGDPSHAVQGLGGSDNQAG